ncbi:MAG: glycosyltransferase [Candidatus Falkowbacteria bacterium]
MKVALVHDHLAQDGGAEKVLKVLTELFPDAPIYTLLFEPKNVSKNFKNKDIRTSIIQRLPGGIKHYRWYLPLMPIAVEFFDLRDYDVVISDASAFAKGVITTSETLHICYCHTPTRYLWSDSHQYLNELSYNKYFKKIIALLLSNLRLWDRAAADRVDTFIANSNFIARRITKYYKRDSQIIYPPVDVDRFGISKEIGDFYLIGGRIVPYKRIDITVEAFKKWGKKLVVFGDGVDLPRLKKIAAGAPNIEFVGRVDDATQAALYQKCLAFIHPQEEDFGITAVEAMASGRPVVAYGRGGILEIVANHKTGVFFHEQTADGLLRVLERFNPLAFDPNVIRAKAESFSRERFRQELKHFIEQEYCRFTQGKCDF